MRTDRNRRRYVIAASLIGVVALIAAVTLSNPLTASDSESTKASSDSSDLKESAEKSKEVDGGETSEAKSEEEYVPKTKAELRRQLSRLQYSVTQNEATERAFTNRYWNNKKKGQYNCIVCDLPLFDSKTKYKSGTGWPSFYAPLQKDAIGTKIDRRLFSTRTEVHCSRCEAHLGHVFNDGPKPTGLRYCMNSASLNFIDQKELEKRREKKSAEASRKSDQKDQPKK